MLRKTSAILLVIIMLILPLAGCAERGGAADVHVFYYTYSDPYISSVRSALGAALKNAGISYQDYDGDRKSVV